MVINDKFKYNTGRINPMKRVCFALYPKDYEELVA
jgi:hypothetical protein